MVKKRPPPTEEQVAECRKMEADPQHFEEMVIVHGHLWGMPFYAARRDVEAFMKFVRAHLQNSVLSPDTPGPPRLLRNAKPGNSRCQAL